MVQSLAVMLHCAGSICFEVALCWEHLCQGCLVVEALLLRLLYAEGTYFVIALFWEHLF